MRKPLAADDTRLGARDLLAVGYLTWSRTGTIAQEGRWRRAVFIGEDAPSA